MYIAANMSKNAIINHFLITALMKKDMIFYTNLKNCMSSSIERMENNINRTSGIASKSNQALCTKSKKARIQSLIIKQNIKLINLMLNSWFTDQNYFPIYKVLNQPRERKWSIRNGSFPHFWSTECADLDRSFTRPKLG